MTDYEDHVAKANLALDAVEHTEDPHQLSYAENAMLAIAHATLAAAAQQEVANRIALVHAEVVYTDADASFPRHQRMIDELMADVFPEGVDR